MESIQKFNSIFVIDFEATCDNNKLFGPPEIIEFPCIQIKTKAFQTVDTFHEYVCPTRNPQLTQFCTELTGISQDTVENADTFPIVFQRFQSWLESRTGSSRQQSQNSYAMLCCGDWDLQTMLPSQCKLEGLEVPAYCHRFINVKRTYSSYMGNKPRGMMTMVNELGLKATGRHHSGIDDTKNIVSIVQQLALRGCVFEINAEI